MEKIFHRVEHGEGDKDDLDLILNISGNIGQYDLSLRRCRGDAGGSVYQEVSRRV